MDRCNDCMHLYDTQTVVEATSGNTGVGLAMACAAKGYPCVVTMADSFSIERRKIMRYFGVSCRHNALSSMAVTAPSDPFIKSHSQLQTMTTGESDIDSPRPKRYTLLIKVLSWV